MLVDICIMDSDVKVEDGRAESDIQITPKRNSSGTNTTDAPPVTKRRCVSTACIACRRRKSKCDGALPRCAACASVYLTDCSYQQNDARRKGVYKKETDGTKTKNSTLQMLVHSLLNHDEDDAIDLLREMRAAENLEEVAQGLEKQPKKPRQGSDSPRYDSDPHNVPQFDAELSGKMGDLLIDGSVKFIGGTSNLVWLDNPSTPVLSPAASESVVVRPREEAILSWTTVTRDKDLILHFLNMYFCWHYPYFTTLSKELFYRDFLTGNCSQYCSNILVNAMLALGCHFSSKPMARSDPEDSTTTGDHFFSEAKRLLYENEELANARLCTVQALALMSVREAGCGRENKGWVYSGMSFRMASDLGLNVDAPAINDSSKLSDEDIDARRITFWGCFLFDKCWSNYLGRQPQLQLAHTNTKKFEVFPSEDSEMWSPYTDAGIINASAQPARTRTVARYILQLAEISSDLLAAFYQPGLFEKPTVKQAELKKLTDIHTRLETWKRDLPAELEPRDGQLPSILLMHMFFHLLYIHLYRPFLRFTKSTSPLPNHVSPRKFCTQAASAVSKLLRLYKRTHGLRQIINKVVYIAHSACTIHLLNLPDKNAKRDIVHGIKQLEEMGECWTAARRTLRILCLCAEKWKIELPEEAQATLARTRARWGSSEPNNGPVSPDTFTNITQQINSHPVSDMMAYNLQHQRVSPQQMPTQMLHQMTSQPMLGLSSPMAPSPADIPDTRRSSGNLSLPPQTAVDLYKNLNRIRQSAQLTQEQQNAWNALQARMATSSIAPSNGRTSAAITGHSAENLFGGVDSLVSENSQDWWYNDQNQLALGFDNWTAPTLEWANTSNSGLGIDDGSAEMSTLPAIGANGLFAPPLHNNYMMNGSHTNANGFQEHGDNNQFATQRLQQGNYPQAHSKRQSTWSNDDLYS